MEQIEKLNKLEDLLEIGLNSLTPETKLESLVEWDSVAILSLIVMLEDDFGKTVKGTTIKECKTIADILQLM